MAIARIGRRAFYIHRRYQRQEFRADFEALARRTLRHDYLQIFRLLYILELDSRRVARLTGIKWESLRVLAHRMEERLGRACIELRPYHLYPIDDYFNRFH